MARPLDVDVVRFMATLGFKIDFLQQPLPAGDDDHPHLSCWPWPGGRKDKKGYGAFKAGGKSWRAHLFAYEAFMGPVPPGLTVDRTCHTRDCCNPKHLRLLTRVENGKAENKRPKGR